jgi:hypothetical protein
MLETHTPDIYDSWAQLLEKFQAYKKISKTQ